MTLFFFFGKGDFQREKSSVPENADILSMELSRAWRYAGNTIDFNIISTSRQIKAAFHCDSNIYNLKRICSGRNVQELKIK